MNHRKTWQPPKKVVYLLLPCLLLLLLLSWRTVWARVCVNAGSLHLSRALLADPVNEEALDRSLALYRKALEVHPGDPAATRQLLRIMREKRVSLAALPVALSDPTTTTDPLTVLYLGERAWDSGERLRALEIWREIDYMEYHFVFAGDRAYAEGDVDAALANYAMSLDIDDMPSFRKRQMYLNLSRIEKRRGDKAKADSWYTLYKEVRRGEGVWNVLYQGRVYMNMGANRLALFTFDQALLCCADIADVHYYAGLAHERLGETDLALQSYARGLALDPTDDKLHMATGELCARQGMRDSAISHLHQVVEHTSDIVLRARAERGLEALSDR